jgi:hypothetical protein
MYNAHSEQMLRDKLKPARRMLTLNARVRSAPYFSFSFEMSDTEVASAAFILMGWCYLQKNKKQKRWWQANLYRDRNVNGVSNLLNILKNKKSVVNTKISLECLLQISCQASCFLSLL